MSTGEIIGLSATAALWGGLVGTVLGVLLARRRQESAAARERRLQAVARWLAATRTLSRASWSLVVSFRALAAERCESPFHSLHEQEAQRSRACWSEAMREFESAEADLTVFGGENADRLARIEHAGLDVIRAATSGEASGLRELRENLRRVDERAECAAAEFVSRENRPTLVRSVLGRMVGAVAEVTDHWSRR